MGAGVRVIVFNTDETYGSELRSTLLSYDGVKIPERTAVQRHRDPIPR